MDKTQAIRFSGIVVSVLTMSMIFGCANYEVNTKRGGVPGHYIRYEMQETDRALEAARQAGKDKTCPAEFKAAEDARNKAYDVYRACQTEEGAALAKQATAKANALCPRQPAAIRQVVPPPAPVPKQYKYCMTLHTEFDVCKTEIRPQYNDELARVGDFMKQYPDTTAIIEGHTDNVPITTGVTCKFADNMVLSQARAESAVNYLVEKFGIDRSRLFAKGYGDTRPVADNATDEGRQKNRRIEAVIDCALLPKEIKPQEKLCMTLVIEFDTDKADIKGQYRDEIAKLGEFMKKYPTTTATIEGHTDNIGSPESNMRLSQQRAESVVDYLVKNFGIYSSRLLAKGYGSTRPIAYNSAPEGSQKNRRIEAIVDCVLK